MMCSAIFRWEDKTRSTYNCAVRVLGFKARAAWLQSSRPSYHPSLPLPSTWWVWVLFPGRNWIWSLMPPAFTQNTTLLKTPKWTSDTPGNPIRWSQTQWLLCRPPNVPRPPNSVTQLPRRAPWLGMPFLASALPQTPVPHVTQLRSSRAGDKPGLCGSRIWALNHHYTESVFHTESQNK